VMMGGKEHCFLEGEAGQEGLSQEA